MSAKKVLKSAIIGPTGIQGILHEVSSWHIRGIFMSKNGSWAIVARERQVVYGFTDCPLGIDAGTPCTKTIVPQPPTKKKKS